LSDDDLTAAAAAGDPRALGVIFERYHEALYRYCVALLDHSEQAAEAVQTTMFAAREGLSERMPPTALRPWLHAIAHAAALAMLKARGESAPPRERSAVLLHEMNGLDYTEVASVLGIARTAARRAVLDAHKALPPGRGDTGRELREVYALPEGVAAAVLGAGQASIGTHDEEDRPRHRVLLSFLVLAVVVGSTVALAALGTFDSGGGGGGDHRGGGPAATPIQVAPGPGQAKPRHKGHKRRKPRRAAGGAGGATPGSGAPGGLTPGAPSSAVSAYTTPGERIESAVGAP
jgi:DNA-directed RNA polymerase specialized sigma24 family protein